MVMEEEDDINRSRKSTCLYRKMCIRPSGHNLKYSTLAGFTSDELFRIWTFIESFRPEGETQKPAPNIWPWAANVPKPRIEDEDNGDDS